MPNIALALKDEISRIARKEVKSEMVGLRKLAFSHRKELAQLKQRAQALERAVRELGRAKATTPTAPLKGDTVAQRFSVKGLAAHRRRLGLSASEVGVLLGTSGQSIYNWEQGKSRPRASHLEAIAALRTLGKRDAAASSPRGPVRKRRPNRSRRSSSP